MKKQARMHYIMHTYTATMRPMLVRIDHSIHKLTPAGAGAVLVGILSRCRYALTSKEDPGYALPMTYMKPPCVARLPTTLESITYSII